MKLKSTEHDEQVAVVAWCRLNKIPIFSVPNGAVLGGRNKYALLNKLKAEGLEPGVPDLFIPKEGGRKELSGENYSNVRITVIAYQNGLFIEMKSAHGRVKPDQQAWVEMLKKNGYRVVICRSAEEAILCIKDYLKEAL